MKYTSDFVKRMRVLNARLIMTRYRLVWLSQEKGTYVRKKHGELK